MFRSAFVLKKGVDEWSKGAAFGKNDYATKQQQHNHDW